MGPINLNSLFLTCKTIVNTEIKSHCDVIIEKLDKLISMTKKKGQKKRMEKLRKKVKKIYKFAKKNRYL